MVRIAGGYAVGPILVYMGFMFWDKNVFVALGLVVFGAALAGKVVLSELEFKKKRHEAPWLFEVYKGD